MRARLLAGSLGFALFGLAACQLVAGLDGDFVQAPEVGEDAGVDAAPTPDAGPACASATYPDPPSAADGADLPDVVLALRTIDLGESATTPPGYDLDGVCTCIADGGPTCASSKSHCDAAGGIDSTSAQFFNLVQFAAGAGNFSSQAFSAKVEEGVWSLLVRVRGYSGAPDDPSVDVAIYPSTGLDPPPVWNGADPWPVQDDSVTDGDVEKPRYVSAGAYVAQGTLVAALPSLAVVLGSEENTMTLHLTGGVLTGKLVKETRWKLKDGVLAARWKIQNVFAALSSYRDSEGLPFCRDQGFGYQTAKDALCNGLDLLADPSGAKTLPCDAISIGIGFTADEEKLGAVAAPVTPLPGCPPETDPIGDSCP